MKRLVHLLVVTSLISLSLGGLNWACNLTPSQRIWARPFGLEYRLVASIYNNFGGWIAAAAEREGIPEDVLAAVIRVESDGKAFVPENGNKMKIRFEACRFQQWYGSGRTPPFSDHFQCTSDPNNDGFRTDKNLAFTRYHQLESQVKEWEVFDFAKTLDRAAAFESASYGLGQVLGQNYQYMGYDSAEDMFNEWDQGMMQQLEGFINFIKNEPSGRCWSSLKASPPNYTRFSSCYNGSTNYATPLSAASTAWKSQVDNRVNYLAPRNPDDPNHTEEKLGRKWSSLADCNFEDDEGKCTETISCKGWLVGTGQCEGAEFCCIFDGSCPWEGAEARAAAAIAAGAVAIFGGAGAASFQRRSRKSKKSKKDADPEADNDENETEKSPDHVPAMMRGPSASGDLLDAGDALIPRKPSTHRKASGGLNAQRRTSKNSRGGRRKSSGKSAGSKNSRGGRPTRRSSGGSGGSARSKGSGGSRSTGRSPGRRASGGSVKSKGSAGGRPNGRSPGRRASGGSVKSKGSVRSGGSRGSLGRRSQGSRGSANRGLSG